MAEKKPSALRTVKKLMGFLGRRQKTEFAGVLVILVVSAALTQLTPLAVEYLTNTVLAAQTIRLGAVLPVLLAILAANVTNEVIKVARRLLVEDTATHIEKCARQRAAEALLAAPLTYFRGRMTGNIHGRLNRSLEGTSKLIKLLFMDFAPAVATAVAAVAVIFVKLPLLVAGIVVLVVPLGILIVLRQIATQKGIRVELIETRAAMDGTTEKLIQKQIERFQAEYGITVLSIAHRLSTLENCDEILVMDKGQIVQRGDFATLRDAPGIFQDMYRGILR